MIVRDFMCIYAVFDKTTDFATYLVSVIRTFHYYKLKKQNVAFNIHKFVPLSKLPCVVRFIHE